ncbi:MAG: GspE/PulE family protein [Planctomycetota bacterium]|nr:GspE/PulE family protein [Planctomycetota bacterium]
MVIVDEVTLCAEASGLDIDRVRELSDFARDRQRSMIEVLVEKGQIDEPTLLKGLAEQLELPFLGQEIKQLGPEILASISPALAIRHHVIPLEEVDGRLQVACWDPLDGQMWDDLCQVMGRALDKVICPRPIIDRMLKASYGIGADTVQRMLADRGEKDIQVVGAKTTNLSSSEEAAANEPTVVNLVNQVLADAIRANATDIHFEAYEEKYRVRYRIDGMLEDVSMPVSVKLLRLALVSRIKIMSNLDITEKRLPQDGRCQASLGGQDYDLRISILPGVHGEAVSIRLQNRQMVKLDLEALGFEATERQKINQLIVRPHGLILVTGPTGSGKTTTLYTCLSKINIPSVKIETIEDPVEYWMENILQMQVHEEIGFTFARALRSMLRHDPDVMLVGEIRDRETADIAIRSSLTGHLVFATLHTNDAASAFTRLLDIGIEPFLVASSVIGVVAQRLVRKVCPLCKRRVLAESLDDFGRQMMQAAGCGEEVKLWEGQRCESCRFTGFRGRSAVAEVLPVTPGIRRLVQQREPAERIKELACLEGMRTLRESAILGVKEGKTTLAEVLRVTQEDF